MFGDFDRFSSYHDKRNAASELALECFEECGKPADSLVKEVICQYLKSNDPSSIQSLKREEQAEVLKKLKMIGLKTSQISRVTGLSEYTIRHTRSDK